MLTLSMSLTFIKQFFLLPVTSLDIAGERLPPKIIHWTLSVTQCLVECVMVLLLAFWKKCYHEYSYTNLILIFENTFLIDFFLKLDIFKSVNFFYPGHVYGLELSKLLKTCKAIKEGLQFAIFCCKFCPIKSVSWDFFSASPFHHSVTT